MQKSALSYANLMNGFNRENQPDKTLKLFDRMKEDSVEPTVPIYLCLIKALAQISLSSLSEHVFSQVPEQFMLNHLIQNASIDLWVSFKWFSDSLHRIKSI